jgi:hypothetical protein
VLGVTGGCRSWSDDYPPTLPLSHRPVATFVEEDVAVVADQDEAVEVGAAVVGGPVVDVVGVAA